jgi:hypothetical protein
MKYNKYYKILKEWLYLQQFINVLIPKSLYIYNNIDYFNFDKDSSFNNNYLSLAYKD